MKVEFDKLTIEHFGTFADKQVLDLKDLGVGMHYVRGINEVEKLGPNGVGKSTMVNALAWCLYGATSNNLKATDIKPWNGKGKPRVVLTARFDGTKRTIARTAPSFTEIDGKEVGQDEIDKLFRMNLEVFKQTVLFGQRRPLFFDLPNKDKLSLLSEVLELDKWEVRSQKASERTRELEDKRTSLVSTITVSTETLKNVRRYIDEAKANRDKWEDEVAEAKRAAKADQKKLRAELEVAEKKSATAKRIAIHAAQRVGEAEGEQVVVKDKLDTIERERARRMERANYLRDQIDKVKNELAGLSKAKSCPTCGQAIKKGDTRQHRQHLETQLAKLSKDLKEASTRPAPEKDPLVKYKHEFIQLKARIVSLNAEYTGRRRDMEEADKTIATIKGRLEGMTTISKEAVNPYMQQLEDLRKQRDTIKASLEDLEAERHAVTRKAERSKYWIKGFKDVRLFVIEDVLNDLEITTNTMLEDMGLLNWQVRYAVERETKSGTIQTGMSISILSPRNTKAVKWEVWSGGESQRLRLAGALALSEVLLSYAGIDIDLEILDEPTAHLSDEGVADLCAMLADRANALDRRILYIDHAAFESDTFASTVTIRKTKAGSTIEYG